MIDKLTSKLVLALMTGLFASSGWTAERGTSKEEAIGFGSGAIVGAAAGGPLGFILGAGLGGWLGDEFHQERSARLEAADRLARAREEADALNGLLRDSERQIARLASTLERQSSAHRTALERAFDIQVFFRTAESAIADTTAERLHRLGELIAPMDGVQVRIEGHADARGDADYNAQLSAERAAAVRDALMRAGVSGERITVMAEGERAAVAEPSDVDALALERRVHLTLFSTDDARRVARQ